MKTKNKLITIATFFLFIFTLNTVSNVSPSPVKAEGEWTKVDTKVLPTYAFGQYDGADAFIYFSLTVNDYSSLSGDYLYVGQGSTTYYNSSDYNFLDYIQISKDNETYVPFSTIYNTNNINYFFKDGTFRFGLNRDVNIVKEVACYDYIKVLEGCEFPSYSYCQSGTNKTKYVQKETTLAKITTLNQPGTYDLSYYGEVLIKKEIELTGIAPGWNNSNKGNRLNYRELILAFGTYGTDYLANNHIADATNRATEQFDIGKKLTRKLTEAQ